MKRYQIDLHMLSWGITVAIDHNFQSVNGTVADFIKQMVEFWSDWKHELALCAGDYTLCFLKRLARKCFYLHCSGNWNTQGLIDELANEEGWCPVDGSYGITLLNADDLDLSLTEFDVAEIEKQA